MGVTEDGIKGEQLLFAWLKKRGVSFFQPDAIGNNIVYEAKHQERFVKPPFDGHGLPRWQVRARLDFAKIKNMRAMLVVFDKETNEVFYQYFDVLEKGEYYDTQGKSPRRIYPLKSFIKDSQQQKLKVVGYTTPCPKCNSPMEKYEDGSIQETCKCGWSL